MKLLKNKVTGVIYIWTEVLSKHDDMIEYERPPTAVIPPEVIKHETKSPEVETKVASPADSDESDIAVMAAAVLKRKAK